MAFFLKEAVLLMVVASVLSFPWRPFETTHAPDSSYGPVQKDLLLLLDDDTGTAVDEPPTDDEVEEVYPGTSTKRTQENSDLNDDETEVDFPIKESRKAFRAKRGVVPKQEYRWPKNQAGNVDIAYTIDGVNDNTERWLNDIFYELKLKTCVRFHKKSAADEHYVTFRKGNGACKSDIGYRGNKDEQLVDLWYPGCDFRGTIMHEVQHLLGFEHEHQRRDRDQYIKIYKDNIKAGLEPQFNLKTQDLVPPYDAYDEHSNMQYNEKAFSKDGTGKTMEARDGQKLGRAAHMDANDVMKINQVYNCPVKKHYVDCKLTVKTGDGLGAGTNADVYMKLNGDKGSTNFEMITEGGMIADENERGSAEDHNMASPDVGTVSSVEVALVEKNAQPPNCSRRRRGQKKRWLISTDGWTVDSVTVTCKSLNGGISQTFAGPVDLYPGDCKTLNLVKKK